jgi:hypothetical protein
VYFQGPILPEDIERDLAMVYGDRKWWRTPAMRFLSYIRRRHSVSKCSLTGIADDFGRAVSVDGIRQLISMSSCAIRKGLR